MLEEKSESLSLGSVIVIFDRDYGTFFFRDLRAYGSLTDDAEWLLERTPQRSWGIMIRPVACGEKYGLWVGEYGPHSNQVIREEITFDGGASSISRALFGYAEHRVEEKEVRRIVTIDTCKRKIRGSRIIQDFKHYTCPAKRFYEDCPHVKETYEAIRSKYGLGVKVHYSLILNVISNVKQCDDVLICPFLSRPNPFERIIVLNEALRSRKLGEIRIVDGNLVQIT
ncbi:MAG: hypothetical protein QW145_05405 [Candidatus Bathyarchaeia archaeon]